VVVSLSVGVNFNFIGGLLLAGVLSGTVDNLDGGRSAETVGFGGKK